MLPGDRVQVFDPTLFINDVSTPLPVTMKSATVVRHYGFKNHGRTYPDVIDVVFDHRPGEVSKMHFTKAVKPL